MALGPASGWPIIAPAGAMGGRGTGQYPPLPTRMPIILPHYDVTWPAPPARPSYTGHCGRWDSTNCSPTMTFRVVQRPHPPQKLLPTIIVSGGVCVGVSSVIRYVCGGGDGSARPGMCGRAGIARSLCGGSAQHAQVHVCLLGIVPVLYVCVCGQNLYRQWKFNNKIRLDKTAKL